MDKTVLLCRAQNYDQALVDRQVEFLFGQLEAAEKLNQNSRVLLKPNLLAKHPPEAAVTTHPAVVRAVIRALKKRGVTHITLADSCGGLYNPAVMKSLYKVSGLWQVCQEEGVECYTECRCGTRPAPEGRVVKEFTLIQPVLDSDFIIDLAKFKTHVMAGCTAATKNLFGCIPGLQKAEWHMRFPDKERHQIFIEPMGADTKEMYLQGLSSSLPEDVQKAVVRSIRGLENAVFMRTAYAIEYDCCDATQLRPTLEFRDIAGLYGAGQFNGSSGYEEAAAQGLVAGINAARTVQGKDEFVLLRSEAYIGALIDDLVTKGTNEPYRIMTSRSEYRLLLRQDNAKARLTPRGREIGLVDDTHWEAFLAEQKAVEDELSRLRGETLPQSGARDALLVKYGYEPVAGGIRKAELLRRPGVTLADIYALEGYTPPDAFAARRAEIEIKYEGYIQKQLAEVARQSAAEHRRIPPDIDYSRIRGLRLEAAQKLSAMRPETVGRASRISGVTPADVAVLLLYLKEQKL